jgi:hypothetical protein
MKKITLLFFVLCGNSVIFAGGNPTVDIPCTTTNLQRPEPIRLAHCLLKYDIPTKTRLPRSNHFVLKRTERTRNLFSLRASAPQKDAPVISEQGLVLDYYDLMICQAAANDFEESCKKHTQG